MRMIKVLIRKLKRSLISCRQLGVHKTALIIVYRLRRHYFMIRMKHKAMQKKARATWERIAKQYDTCWHTFFTMRSMQSLPYIDTLQANKHEELEELATYFAKHQFKALGSDWYVLDDMMWHTDIRLKQQRASDYQFDATSFYADIVITYGMSEKLEKDIKVPWELSRLQHLPVLAYAYKKQQDNCYVQAFMHHVSHWQQHNSYLLGINWLCPMEVGLRAISLVIAFDGFKQADVPTCFWQQYVALLYDHMLYLEYNWEWYDGKTSNHYLSDLVGYLYLCYFFKDMKGMSKKIDRCVQEIMRECDKQVFDEGADYEGSTRYHVLVTELFFHAQELCNIMNITLPVSFQQKLARMIDFIQWCTINEHDMITIGDHDSGKVTWVGLPTHLVHRTSCQHKVKHFKQFGLSIIADHTWHISLRHQAYTSRQPSGHHHNDSGSITLAVHGIPVLVDPGSYVYTASAIWRNRLRSISMHNVMSIAGQEPAPLDAGLFLLPMQESKMDMQEEHDICLVSTSRLYEHMGLTYVRNLYIDNKGCTIRDRWLGSSPKNEDMVAYSNFNFAHTIEVKKEEGCWYMVYQGKSLARLVTEYPLYQQTGYCSITYGRIYETVQLCGIVPLEIEKDYVYRFEILSRG